MVRGDPKGVFAVAVGDMKGELAVTFWFEVEVSPKDDTVVLPNPGASLLAAGDDPLKGD